MIILIFLLLIIFPQPALAIKPAQNPVEQNKTIEEERREFLLKEIFEENESPKPEELAKMEKEAIKNYRQAVKESSNQENTTRILLRLGQINLQRKFFAEALGYFKKIIMDFPESKFAGAAKINLGYSYFLQKKHQESLAIFEEIIQEEKKSPPIISSPKKGKKGPIGPVQNIPKKNDPAKIKAYFRVADVYYYLRDYTQAVKYYETGLSFDSNYFQHHPLSLLNLSQIYILTKDYTKAEKMLNIFITDYPATTHTILARGKIADIYVLTNKHEEAEKIYTQIIISKKFGTYSDLWAKVGLADLNASRGGYKNFFPDLAALKEMYPLVTLDDELMFKLGKVYLIQKMHEEALQSFNLLINKYKESPLIYLAREERFKTLHVLIEDKYQEENYLAVIKHFDKNKKHFIDQALDQKEKILSYVADSYKKIGIPQTANLIYEEIIKITKNNELASQAFFQIAKNYYLEGNYSQAKISFEMLGKKYLHDKYGIFAHRYLGYILYKEGKNKEAWNEYCSWIDGWLDELELGDDLDTDKNEVLFVNFKNNFLRIDFSEERIIFHLRFIEMIAPDKELFPSIAQLYFLLGNAYASEKQYHDAIAAYHQSLVQDPEFIKEPWVNYQLAKAYILFDKKDEAIKILGSGKGRESSGLGGQNILINLNREYLLATDLEKRIGKAN